MNVKWRTLSMMVPSHDTPFLWLVGQAMVLKFGCSINFSLIMCWFLPWAEFWFSLWFQINKMKNSLDHQNRYNTVLYWPTSKHGEIGSCYTKPLFSHQLIMLIHCLNNQNEQRGYPTIPITPTQNLQRKIQMDTFWPNKNQIISFAFTKYDIFPGK